MTEDELREHACQMAEVRDAGPQPPFDYEGARVEAFEAVLGPADHIFHTPLGAPHIDLHRYPPCDMREFWCYATNGMSDFPANAA